MDINSRILKIYGSVELSPDQQAQIQSAYESGKDLELTIKGDIRGFGMRIANDDGTEDVASRFKVELITEITEK